MNKLAELEDAMSGKGGGEKYSVCELERKTICDVPPEDWNSKRLGTIAEIVSGNSLPNKEQGMMEGFPVYKVSDMNKPENLKYMNSAENRLKKKKMEKLNHCLHPAHTVILPKVGAALLTNKRRILKEKSSFDNNVMGWIPGEELNPEYFYYTTCKVDMEAYAQKGAVPSISKSIASNIKFPVPPLEEQRKSASVLYNLDQAIQKKEEIIEQTRRVKKGLMQDLFTEGYYEHGEFKKARIGPKKYEIPSEWSVEAIAEIGEVITGDTPSTDKEENFGDKYPFVTPEDLKDNKYITEVRRGITDQGMAETNEIPEDAVMMDCIGSDLGKVAISKRKLATNQQINSIIPNVEIDSEFLYYSLQFISETLKAQAGATATPIVRKSSFSALEFFKPGKEEQKKIGSTLKSLDGKIEQLQKEKEQLQQVKKGLMQDLLTGKIRTKDKDIEVLDEVLEVEK